jgi:mono/diheme cytochrome c family protein
MLTRIRLTTHTVKLCVLVLLLLLATACQQGSVTESAQANPNTPAASPTPPDAAATAAPTATVVASPSPGMPGVVGPVGQAQPLASGSPGASPGGRTLNGGKTIIVDASKSNNTDPTLMPPPPTPTPTPAPTPQVVSVNGKIKQQWEAPAEFAQMKSPLKMTPDLLQQGKALYKMRCEMCHGEKGQGNGPYNGPQWQQSTNLASQAVQANTDGELFYKVTTARNRHPASKVRFTDEERWMIVAFLRSFK